MYLEKRFRTWYACHDIPADVQDVIGRKRFFETLETEDKSEAQRRAGILKSRWLSAIAKARQVDHAARDAEYWARAYRTAAAHEKEAVKDLIADEAEIMREKAAVKAGIFSKDHPGYGSPAADRFQAIATGTVVRLDEHLTDYLGTLKNEQKSIDMKKSTINKFVEEFPYTSDIGRKEVQKWVNGQIKAGKALATVRRSLSELRGYWTYLQSIEVVSEDLQPFEKLTLPKTGKDRAERREAFTPEEVVKLHSAASGDKPLADLIYMAMYTGARIEELCSLKASKVGKTYFDVDDAKTEAGWRRVPIHTKLIPVIKRLKDASTDGYILSGLGTNKYGDRSAAIGKRFGRLKTELGFGPGQVFHCIRKTVATMLENAGVAESVAAGILGHDHPTMTFGLYSGGADLEVKAAAVEKLEYYNTK